MSVLVSELRTPYVWAHCPIPCNHSAALPIDALLRRAGQNLTTDALRHRLRCSVCDHKGGNLIIPTSPGTGKPWEPIPLDRAPEWAKRQRA